MKKILFILFYGLLPGLGGFAFAQSHAGHGSQTYKSPASADVEDWRAANDRVHEAGGWKAYAREIERAQKETTDVKVNAKVLGSDEAFAIALSLEPALRQALSAVSIRDAEQNYLQLTAAERDALTKRAALQAEVLRLYYAAVAAQEKLRYQQQVTETASIAAELAARMRKVGNLNALHQSEEQLSYAETIKALSRAEENALASREALIRRLQLSGSRAEFALADRLPSLPQNLRALTSVEQKLLADSQFPGSKRPTLLKAQSEAREAYGNYQRAYTLAKHYRDEILPIQKRISEEHLLHYNGMIIGVFDLLKDARHNIKAVEGYLEALHAFWNADLNVRARLMTLKEFSADTRRDAWKR